MSTEELALPGLPTVIVPLTVSINADLDMTADLFFDPRCLVHVFSLDSDKPSIMLNSAFGRQNRIGANHPEWKRGELGGWPDEQAIDVTIYGPTTSLYVDSATFAHLVHHYIDCVYRDDHASACA